MKFSTKTDHNIDYPHYILVIIAGVFNFKEQKLGCNMFLLWHAVITIIAVTVSPADVDPIPVVHTDRGITLAACRSNCDLPVPGSPTSNR